MIIVDTIAFWSVVSVGLGLLIGPALRKVTAEPSSRPAGHNRRIGDQ
ncbi:hypothetical protein [Sphingomonas sp. PvP056]|jgi:hypothetical protein